MKELDPEKIYTKTELNELLELSLLSGIKNVLCSSYSKTRGYGMIMKKLDGSKYQLYPELKEAFYRYF